jgi:Zn-dependent peptidase ImmA (M78 family)/DNA-binding XRE family transcriptional regulator
MQGPISQRLIGHRIKAARVAAERTQEDLTRALGLNDRQSVSDIENGKRALKPDEWVTLSGYLGLDLESFLDPLTVAGEAQFSWRAHPSIPQSTLDAFERVASRWVGVLRWLRTRGERSPASALKPTLRLSARSSFEDAQDCAEALARELGLGRVPTDDLIDRIERRLDIPVLYVDAPTTDGASISGAACHLDDLAVLLINRHESVARRHFDLAHELFHALSWDALRPAPRESAAIDGVRPVKRVEQLADNFAAALLMPRASIDALIDRSRATDLDHLRDAAEVLRVAPVSLAWRLFNLRLIDEPTRQQLARERQRPVADDVPPRFSRAFVEMLHEALDRGEISARKAAGSMGLDLDGLRTLFAEHGRPAPFDL